jgi:hypothetical protein
MNYHDPEDVHDPGMPGADYPGTDAGEIPVVMTFGGKSSVDWSEDAAGIMTKTLLRPEQIKSLVKSGDSFEECTDRSVCWRGCGCGVTNPDYDDCPGGHQTDAAATIRVPAGTPIKTYAYEAWVRCLGDKTTFEALGVETSNGVLKVFANDKLMEGVEDDDKPKVDKVTSGKRIDYTFHSGADDGPAKDFIVRAEFTPSDETAAAWGLFELRADGVTKFTDKCMKTKFCLNELAQGNMGFKVRNSHEFQLKCLDDTAEDDLKETCGKWRECLQKSAPQKKGEPNHVDLLHALLKATTKGSAGGGSLIQHDEHAYANAQKESCFDPSVSDPERLECDCQEGITSVCKDDDDGLVKCIQRKLCQHPGVCQPWKDVKCGGMHAEVQPAAPALLQRAQVQEVDATHSATESVDRAVLAKTCTD